MVRLDAVQGEELSDEDRVGDRDSGGAAAAVSLSPVRRSTARMQSAANGVALLRTSQFEEAGLDAREQSWRDETVAEDVRQTG